MTKNTVEPNTTGIHTVQPERDLVSNWEVDLAQKLEDYLLKICSGEITGEEDGPIAVNFAEAALLIQGSVQVYSRKVEYLYNLVLRALEFLSQKRQQETVDGTSVQTGDNGPSIVNDDENDLFWVPDDIPADERNSLDTASGRDVSANHFVKPPANLVVLEGDCLDPAGDGGELESFLLATHDLYRDFILLDACDAVSVQEYLNRNGAGEVQGSAYRGSSRKSFVSSRNSSGSANKSSVRKSQHSGVNLSPQVNCGFDINNARGSPPVSTNFDGANVECDMNGRYSEHEEFENSDNDSDEDPWKPLNPHEPGNLKVKPFRKVKAFKRNGVNVKKRISISTLFPPAKLHGPIDPELTDLWKMRCDAFERQRGCRSPPLYEKLRESLVHGWQANCDAIPNPEGDNVDGGYDDANPFFSMPEDMDMDEGITLHNGKGNGNDDNDTNFDKNDAFAPDYPNSQETLEDLCRSHLDALLTSIAETEKQTEMAARVSSWKQRIEHNIEEQESHPPFDIHDYGERILNKVSEVPSSGEVLSFSDVVRGQEKYDVARSFSALLQLVNNGDVELERRQSDGKHAVCYTDVNPFSVRLLNHEKVKGKAKVRLPKKRPNSPTRKASPAHRTMRSKFDRDMSPTTSSFSDEHRPMKLSSTSNCKFPVKLGKISARRCSPEARRRRRSQFVEPS